MLSRPGALQPLLRSPVQLCLPPGAMFPVLARVSYKSLITYVNIRLVLVGV